MLAQEGAGISAHVGSGGGQVVISAHFGSGGERVVISAHVGWEGGRGGSG
jgi:hypothetical protein